MNPLRKIGSWFSFRPRTAKLRIQNVVSSFGIVHIVHYRHPLTLIIKVIRIGQTSNPLLQC